jgi:magnesium chelatase subunit D
MSAECEASPWAHAGLVAALFAVDFRLGGVAVRTRAGHVRDEWLRQLLALLPKGTPVRRVQPGIDDESLLGGLDLAATLRAGRRLASTGLLAQAEGGVLIMPMAERVPAATAARIVAALDLGLPVTGPAQATPRAPLQFGIVALDEGENPDESPPRILTDRLAFHLDLESISHRDIEIFDYNLERVSEARHRLALVETLPSAIDALVTVAARFGLVSFRGPLFALRAARALCALRGADQVEEDDLALAARLVLAPRAVAFLPESQPESAPAEPDEGTEPISVPEGNTGENEAAPEDLADILVAATLSAIPPKLLDRLSAGAQRGKTERSGKSESKGSSAQRGRPIGVRADDLRQGRLGLIDTLRAAAPWQRLRASTHRVEHTSRILVRREDFRIVRFRNRRSTTAIFVVDASGSAAMQRLAEVKGAIELLLADCYVRRDSVALISFRGKSAEIVLPPTRSLVRAKRTLAGMSGGGGTPLASGIDVALELADRVRRKGQSPLLVVMTDGRANIGRDGEPGRTRAFEDALNAGQRVKATGIAALAIDTAPLILVRAERPTLRLGEAMNARYLQLPNAEAARVSDAVRASAAPA